MVLSYFTTDDTMDQRRCLVIFFVILLMEPFAVFCHDDDTVSEKRQKRFVPAIPVVYFGAEVAVALFASLVAKAVRRASKRKQAYFGKRTLARAIVRRTSILFDDLGVKEVALDRRPMLEKSVTIIYS